MLPLDDIFTGKNSPNRFRPGLRPRPLAGFKEAYFYGEGREEKEGEGREERGGNKKGIEMGER